ncbi:LVIVD repeat-containing protein [Pyxidicoccus sp. MSG2]|uniref:LVIVD repeat-containing protein n=1 Tax=Pyxidicoccus sp. MSG2 TaxID=2996790 RepID=UPI002271A4FA|nr:hypothetical protein [Pyxidicoccus sp. MSG2]MCY1018757.1 hypothetical protein [Pyxidicoccus sp. MSG2]
MAGAMRTWLMLTGLLALAVPRGSAAQDSRRQPRHGLPRSERFELIGHHPLPNPGDTIARGRNGPTGISGDCLYVGSRIGRRPGTGPLFGTPPLPPEVLIVDISNPRRPRPVGALPTVLNATSRELRTIPDAHTLIVMNFRETGEDSGAVNNYQLYDITHCRRPVLRQTISLGTDRPHEFFLWRDPREPARFLLYSSVHLGDVREPSLRVFELMAPPDGPISPRPVATFTLTPAESASISVSQDGTRVYVANLHGGYSVLDSSRLANREPCIRDTVTVDETSGTDPDLCLRKLNPDPAVRGALTPPSASTEHSVYPVPGRPYLVISGERNGTQTCPRSWGHILDISNEQRPQVVSRYLLPENLEPPCVPGDPGSPSLPRESSPQQLVFPNLFFSSGYSAGLRVWDIANPVLPMEVGVYVPRPASRVVERFRDSPDVGMWPHPILYNGLIYITDENSGLYVLRYKGPRANELPRTGLFVSNTNYLAPPPRLARAPSPVAPERPKGN